MKRGTWERHCSNCAGASVTPKPGIVLCATWRGVCFLVARIAVTVALPVDRETEERERHRKGLQGVLSDAEGMEPW